MAEKTTYEELEQRICDLVPGDHLCCIYETEEERRAWLIPFIRQGLEHGERVLYILDAHTAEEILNYLSDDGLETESYLERGQLVFLSVDEAYVQQGIFDPDGMITLLRGLMEQALNEGYSALRLAGEMTWVLKGLPGSERLIEYEAKLNEFFPNSKCLAICQYDKSRFAPEILLDVLTTHPIAGIGTGMFDNFYYIPPEDYLGHDSAEKILKNRLDALIVRRQAQEALAETETRFRELAELLPETIYEMDLSGKLLFVNRAAFDKFGYTQSDFLRGLNSFDMIVPEDCDRALKNTERILEGQMLGLTEYTVQRKDGTTFPAMFRSTAIVRGGRPVGLRGIIIDISALKKAEEKILFLSKAIDDAFSGVAITDMEGNYTYVNQSYSRMHRHNPDELIGENMSRVVPDEYKEVFESDIVPSLHKGAWSRETKGKKKDGAVFDIMISMSLIKNENGNPVALLSICEDITERKLSEKAVIKAKEDWERTFNALPELIAVIDDSFKMVRVNKAMADKLGMTPDEVIGLTCYEQIHGTEEPPPFCPHAKLLADGHEHSAEVHDDRLNGDFFITVSPIYGTDGHVEGCVHVAHDITERIQAEEEKAKLETQLQQAQKMEAIGALAGGVAHDLNNVLSGIVSYPDLLLMQLPEDSPLIEPIRTIQSTGKKAAAIVQDLLTLARRGVLVSEVVNLNAIIEEYLASLEYKKLKSFHPGIVAEANLEADLLNVLGSPIHLSQSVMNLISNAAESMPEGGKLSISTRNQYIDRPINGCDYIEEGDYAVLIISDTGGGISSEDLERIFEPFYTKKKMGRSGTGLGMAVVWGTVKDHKGYIEVQSAVGEGTTFTIYFPVTRQRPAKDETETSAETYRGSGETILIIDDVKEQREIASSILSELGYSVSTVSSGEEAVEYLKNDSVDLLLLDMIMEPGMDGLDTYKKILQLHPGQKAIIASGFSETDRIKMAQRLGAGKYIRKPYTLEKIAIMVKNEIVKR